MLLNDEILLKSKLDKLSKQTTWLAKKHKIRQKIKDLAEKLEKPQSFISKYESKERRDHWKT